MKIHIKIETGNNRQGVLLKDLVSFAKAVRKFKNIEIEGLTSHFANIEDSEDNSYAKLQLARFKSAIKKLENIGVHVPIKHCANSAATILFPETHFQLVRVGIASYGLWPSSHLHFRSAGGNHFKLIPALTWKSKIAQIKTVPSGEFIGYGLTYKTAKKTRLAIISIGYYDGYDRGIKNGHVLIHNKKAPIRGRICMNIIMADVTNIPEAKLEDDVVLMGEGRGKNGITKKGSAKISAEQFADWAGTINYEVTTRINERILRRLV